MYKVLGKSEMKQIEFEESIIDITQGAFRDHVWCLLIRAITTIRRRDETIKKLRADVHYWMDQSDGG